MVNIPITVVAIALLVIGSFAQVGLFTLAYAGVGTVEVSNPSVSGEGDTVNFRATLSNTFSLDIVYFEVHQIQEADSLELAAPLFLEEKLIGAGESILISHEFTNLAQGTYRYSLFIWATDYTALARKTELTFQVVEDPLVNILCSGGGSCEGLAELSPAPGIHTFTFGTTQSFSVLSVEEGKVFAGWLICGGELLGGCSPFTSTSNPIVLQMDRDYDVMAIINDEQRVATFTLTIGVVNPDWGLVTSDGRLIEFSDSRVDFDEGSLVTVTARPADNITSGEITTFFSVSRVLVLAGGTVLQEDVYPNENEFTKGSTEMKSVTVNLNQDILVQWIFSSNTIITNLEELEHKAFIDGCLSQNLGFSTEDCEIIFEGGEPRVGGNDKPSCEVNPAQLKCNVEDDINDDGDVDEENEASLDLSPIGIPLLIVGGLGTIVGVVDPFKKKSARG